MEQNLGHYIVDGKFYYSKSHALYESSISSKKIEWSFNNKVWENFSKNRLNTLGKTPLDTLYKERAQQLRDKYDYLILNYSGGPDSHNILMTFINNNIHLDEVYVKYSHSVESKLYTPNTTITGAENIFSEWDFCIKPTLEWLAKEHPSIKIKVHDVYKDDLKFKLNDDTFITTGHFLGAFEIIRQQTFSDSLIAQSDKNKKVCGIYGIDKPNVFSEDNQFYMFFHDQAVNVVAKGATVNQNMSQITELFYWTPDMPDIVFEQSYRILEYFRLHPELRHLHDIKIFKRNDDNRNEQMRRLMIPLIYTTWDQTKFQASKPVAVNDAGRSRDLYLLARPEFKNYIDNWRGRYKEWRLSINETEMNDSQMKFLLTRRYKVGNI